MLLSRFEGDVKGVSNIEAHETPRAEEVPAGAREEGKDVEKRENVLKAEGEGVSNSSAPDMPQPLGSPSVLGPEQGVSNPSDPKDADAEMGGAPPEPPTGRFVHWLPRWKIL